MAAEDGAEGAAVGGGGAHIGDEERDMVNLAHVTGLDGHGNLCTGVAAQQVVVVQSQGRLALSPSPSGWQRLASVLPLMLLVLGLVTIQHLHEQAEIRAAAEIDAALLADDLPPEAYGDPGFGAYLKQPEP